MQLATLRTAHAPGGRNEKGSAMGRERKDTKLIAAEKLWRGLRSNMLNAEQNLINIIRSKAWEPLGHETFAKAWVEEMSDITLAIELRPHVVYQLIDDGLTSDDVADAVKGVGRATAAALKRQKDNGVPASLASMRPKKKRAQLPYVRVGIRVPREQMAGWQRKARRDGRSVEEIVYSAAAQAFEQL